MSMFAHMSILKLECVYICIHIHTNIIKPGQKLSMLGSNNLDSTVLLDMHLEVMMHFLRG